MTETDKKIVMDSMVFIEDTIKKAHGFTHRSHEVTALINFLGEDLCNNYHKTKRAVEDYETMVSKLHMVNMLAIANDIVDVDDVNERTSLLISRLDKPLLDLIECTKKMAVVLDNAMKDAPF